MDEAGLGGHAGGMSPWQQPPGGYPAPPGPGYSYRDAGMQWSQASYRAPGRGVSMGMLAALLVMFAALVVAILGGAIENEDLTLGAVAVLVLALFVRMPLALVWIHQAWASLPFEERYTNSGRAITPGQAIGFLFVPFYNLYWAFAMSMGLCEALDRYARRSGSVQRTSSGLAVAAGVVQLIPYVNFLLGGVLWTVLAFRLDAVMADIQRASETQRQLVPSLPEHAHAMGVVYGAPPLHDAQPGRYGGGGGYGQA